MYTVHPLGNSLAMLTRSQTKGRTFQELDELFESKTKTRHFKRAKTQLQLAEAQGLSPASMTA